MSETVKSVKKAFDVIEYLADQEDAVPLSAIASVCDFPVPTTYRILRSLCTMGYVKKIGGGEYKLTPKLFEMSSKIVLNNNLVDIVRPYLDELSFRSNETVHLAVRDESSVVIVYKVLKSAGPFQMAARIGIRFPMYRCGVGKAISYTLSDEELLEIFPDNDQLPATAKTITDANEFIKQCHAFKKMNYALDDEENERGVYCIAMPIAPSNKPATYAFSISMFRDYVTEERQKELLGMMEQTREKMLSELCFV